MVTFFLAGATDVPRGECELHLYCVRCCSVDDKGLPTVRDVLDLVPRYSNKPHDFPNVEAIWMRNNWRSGIKIGEFRILRALNNGLL